MNRSILPTSSSFIQVCRLGLSLLLIAGVAFTAEAREYPQPVGWTSSELKSVETVEVVKLDPLDVPRLVAEDERVHMKEPLRFAVPQTIDRGLHSGGSWEALPDGTSVWRLRINAPGAAGLAPFFSRVRIPDGAHLHIYAADGSQRIRPFTSADQGSRGELQAPVLPVDSLIVELELPAGSRRADSSLLLTHVLHAYRDLSGRAVSELAIEKSDSCNVDVACALGQQWSNEVRAVARIELGPNRCTGFLVNNTAEDGRPLFMTARHCDRVLTHTSNMVTYWNFENTDCRTPGTLDAAGPGDGVLDEFTTGATLLATDERSDYIVAELSSSPDAFGTYYLGWDARKIAPTSSITIHHPDAEEKRISLENEPAFFDIYPDPRVPEDPDSHIQIVDWDEGTTEGGSSGGPLFDETTRRVVGQLHGGLASCDDALPDWYGAMWRSFELGLREVLDPADTGVDFIDGIGGSGVNCINDATTLCLTSGRFEVTVDWRDFEGNSGPGQTVSARTADSGLFWFFGDQNWELLVKVLDACDDPFNRYWVFFAATTNVEYTLTVTDTETEESKTYSNPLGNLAQAVTDTDAFDTCP